MKRILQIALATALITSFVWVPALADTLGVKQGLALVKDGASASAVGNYSVIVSGWDGSNYQFMSVNSSGELQLGTVTTSDSTLSAVSATAPFNVGGGNTTITATIADSQTTSGEINLENFTLIGFHLDSGFNGTSLKYQCADATGGTFNDIQDDAGTDCENTTAASQFTSPKGGACAVAVAACQFLKLVASSQTGATTIKVVAK